MKSHIEAARQLYQPSHKALNENDRTIFKAKCQSEFDEQLPKAYSLTEEGTGKPCDTEIILRYSDLGKSFGATYSPFFQKDGKYYGQHSVTLNAQLVDHPDKTQTIIAHELAHFVIDHIKFHHGITDRRGEWGVHGSEWKKVARSLGDSGDRCHSLNLLPATFKARATVQEDERFHLQCQPFHTMNNRLIALHQRNLTISLPQFPVDENLPFCCVPLFDFNNLADHTLCTAEGSPLSAKQEPDQGNDGMLDNLEKHKSDYQGNQYVLNHDCLEPESNGTQA